MMLAALIRYQDRQSIMLRRGKVSIVNPVFEVAKLENRLILVAEDNKLLR
jgi:hypothetical protein